MEISDLEKWKAANLDLVSEALEKHSKAIILLAGASSSGKSYAGELLTAFLQENGLKTLSITTDSYNRGISHIIVDKVNQNAFNGQLKNIEQLKEIAKNAIINLEFDEKFAKESLKEIAKKSAVFLNGESQINKYVNALNHEFKRISFDETTVYDLALAAKDVLALADGQTIMQKEYSKKISEQQPTNKYISGKNYDVILLEGIYALDDKITNVLNKENVISNFIMANEKTLFIRRILRDSQYVPNTFTIKNYFEAVLPAYKKDILPKAKQADIMFYNNISFKELREGKITSVHKRVKVENLKMLALFVSKCKLLSKTDFKDYYIDLNDNISSDESQIIFRCASYDNAKTFSPYSLVQKGNVKIRKDGKIIRPVNILLDEKQIAQTFKNENEFFDLIKNSDFKNITCIEKQRLRLQYKDNYITIDNIKNDGIYIELNGLGLKKEIAENFDLKLNEKQADLKNKKEKDYFKK